MSVVLTDGFAVGSDIGLTSYTGGSVATTWASVRNGSSLNIPAARDRVESSLSGDDAHCFVDFAGCPTGDQKISATLGVQTGYDAGMLLVRASANNCYQCIRGSASVWELYRIDGGSYTLVQSISVATTNGVDQAAALKAEGTGATVTITATIAGADQTPFADSSGSRKTSGRPGVGVYANTASSSQWVDDISVDDLAASGAILGTTTLTFGAGSSTLTGAGALAGTAANVFGAGSSTLRGTGALAGTAALTFAAGSSTLRGTGALAGTAALTFTPAGVLTGAGALAGSCALVFDDGTSTLTGAGSLAGSAAMVFDGTLALSGDISGTSALVFGAGSSTLTGAGALAGSAALLFGAGSSTLTGAGALAGTAAAVFTAEGDLTNAASGDISGTASMSFGESAALTGSGALLGETAIAFLASLTTTEEPAPTPTARAGGRGRNYIIGGRRYYNLTNEELAYLLGHLAKEERRELVRADVKVTFKDKKAHPVSKNAWAEIQEVLKKFEPDPIDDDEEAAMLLL